MPGMDGFTLLKKLQEEIITQSIPVILITSLSDAENEERGLVLGAVESISNMQIENGTCIRMASCHFVML